VLRVVRRVGEIGARLFLDSGTLTPVLRRLERLGFVTRTRDRDDERHVLVALTERGRRLEGEMATIRSEVARRTAPNTRAFERLRSELRGLQAQLAAGPPGGPAAGGAVRGIDWMRCSKV
jgi:DNA-binding MarR family transcriptional regulator